MNIVERNAVLMLAQRALQERKSVSLHPSQVIELVEIIEALQSGDVKMGYAGRCTQCGHICAAVIARPDKPQRTADNVAEFIKEGLLIELLPIEKIRAELHECTCEEGGDDETT